MHMMRKWGAFDEEKTFYDPNRQLVKEDWRQLICTGAEWETMDLDKPRKKKQNEKRMSTIHNGNVYLVAPRMTAVVMDGRRAAVGSGIALSVVQ